MNVQQITATLTPHLESAGDTNKISALLATAIAITLPVPAESAGITGVAHYNSNHANIVRTLVNEVNEVLYVDVVETLDLVKQTYATRFDLVHNASLALNAMVAVQNHLLETAEEGSGNTVPKIAVDELKAVVICVSEHLN